MSPNLPTLLTQIRACDVCGGQLPLGPRPVVRASTTARLLIIGQAPGTRVHASGIPWDDRSGVRLRQWLGVEAAVFYDDSRIAIMPMGLCYPGVDPRGGDKPPRPECAPLWHPPLLALMSAIQLVLLVGRHAQARYLGERQSPTLTQTVARWRDFGPRFIPLPHPSWRNTAWLSKHPWFEAELLPVLRERVHDCL